MKNTIKSFWIIAIGAVIAISLTSCTTNVATAKATNFDKKPLALGDPSYTVLGPVLLEKDWSGILGFTTATVALPIVTFGGNGTQFYQLEGNDFYLWQNGGVTYADLLAKAQEKYPDADAVIDIKVDYSGSAYWIFYAKRVNILTGIAIKYSKTEVKPNNTGAKGNVNLTF